MKTRSVFALILLFLFSFWSQNSLSSQKTPAKSGRISLKGSDLEGGVPIPLSGDWEFFYQKLAKDIHPGISPQILKVPGDWIGLDEFEGEYTEGYGTYKIQIEGLQEDHLYGLKIPTIHSSSRIWLNGNLVSQYGEVGKNENSTLAEIGGQVLFFKGEGPNMEILIEVANFHFFQSGIWSPIYLGTSDSILRLDRKVRMFSFLLVGALLIMGVYHLFLVYIQRSYLESLYFGLACIFLALREMSGPDAILLDLFPDLSHIMIVRLVYISLGLAFMFQNLFIFRLFLEKKFFWVYYLQLGLTAFYVLGILLLPTRDGSIFFNYFALFVTPPFILFGLYVVVRAIVKRMGESWVFTIGLLFFYGAAAHDFIQEYQEAGKFTSYWMPYGFFFLILSESVVLSLRFNRAFINEAKLSKQLRETNVSLRRFIPENFLKLLGKNEITEVKLGDAITKDMTVFFADVRNFTSLSEGLSSKETFEFVNRLLSKTDPIIRKNHGFIDKYIGDAVMALFEQSPDGAIHTALELQQEIRKNNLLADTKIGIGIGIHYGNLILGTVGSDYRMDSTVISDAVNSASRIEELTKVYMLDILISEDCKNHIITPEAFHFRYVDTLSLRGKKSQTRLFEVRSKEQAYPEEFLKVYYLGVEAFRSVAVKEAKDYLERALTLIPEDGPTLYLLRKIAEYSQIQENL